MKRERILWTLALADLALLTASHLTLTWGMTYQAITDTPIYHNYNAAGEIWFELILASLGILGLPILWLAVIQ